MANEEWEARHLPDPKNAAAPSHLYTDENPATTIKGTGFKDRPTAERTIHLTSQPGVRYKQFWTIKAMRERAFHHPNQTPDMRDAMEVFDEWLGRYAPPSAEERRRQEKEWEEYRTLCASAANRHSYGRNPSGEDLKRARGDVKEGQTCLLDMLRRGQRNSGSGSEVAFSVTSFTALFGGPGLHGYGKHSISARESHVTIEGPSGLEELLGKRPPLLAAQPKRIIVAYDREREVARCEIEYDKPPVTMDRFLGKNKSTCSIGSDSDEVKSFWQCETCTFVHAGESKRHFLACEVCATERKSTIQYVASSSKVSKASKMNPTAPARPTRTAMTCISPPATSWGSLRAPSIKDISGPRKRRKGLDSPPAMLDYIIVLDFEWTADNKRKMSPVAEITQFPSVLLKLRDGTKRVDTDNPPLSSELQRVIPPDLTSHAPPSAVNDAYCISVFDTFVRPTLNPILTDFSVELTGITQAQVDAAPPIGAVLQRYLKWLHSLHLADEDGNRVGNWSFATWGDMDLMTTLRLELAYKSIALPRCFHRWINLKDNTVFKRHYGREPRGGLRSCVESVGAKWDGRAHNGFVDSINTAKIVRDMVHTGFRFTRSTRGLDGDGVPFGQKKGQDVGGVSGRQ